ncbi:D-aminoacylase [Pollutibacter soli]|uniref:N-acyl-D-amino-acid deacylase family protein n=1 Tax=Pollutibacter soli TaxID=3034157 RepID=UPI003013F129
MKKISFFILICIFLFACKQSEKYDTIIRNGLVFDGKGNEPIKADVGIRSDTIAFIGDLSSASADSIVDAGGKAVTPGFINMLSWATASLIHDGRSLGDLSQGVTLEVMGEGWSMGPLTESMQKMEEADQADFTYPVTWKTLGGYLQTLEDSGISCNVASFVGATTIRQYVLGENNVQATPAQLDSMRMLVRQAMEEGAMGVGSSLIYPPAFFASTEELIALCAEASKYGGSYISHIRSEGSRLYEAVEELMTIAEKAKIPAEIYHLKAAGKSNWYKIDSVIKRIEKARSSGMDIRADMYVYPAGGTGLTATMPPTLQDGGFDLLRKRLMDPSIRKSVKKEMNQPTDKWENFYLAVGKPENILLTGFKQDSLKKFTGKSLAEIAAIRNTGPEETAMDLIVQDSTRVEAIYFMIDEANIEKEVKLSWISFGSDEGSFAPEGVFLKSNVHPRAYGNVARLLGTYVREKKLIPLKDAIHRLSGFPARNLKLSKRGTIESGQYADIVIFDPETITDHASFEKPHQLATGVTDVWVNGRQVIKNGNHTGVKPGRFVKGPGWKK